MADVKEKAQKKRIFPWFMGIYAVVILIAMALGLNYLHGYLQSYEQSLPYNTTDAYLQTLTSDYICQKASDVLTQIDTSIQTKEEALAAMKSALTEPITFYKRVNESTDTKIVYTLRSGKQAIGSFQIEPAPEENQGFYSWIVTGESFDLSFLLEDGFSVTVPHDALVTVNDKTLTEQHITETGIPYSSLKDFYDEYDLPTMTTYTVGRHLGSVTTEITDAAGNSIDPNAEQSVLLDNCTDQEKTALDTIADKFISGYIHFTSQTNNDLYGNLERACAHTVPGGALEKRLRDAARGLNWVSDRLVTIKSIDISQYVAAGNGKYICKVTYIVETHDITGTVESESNLSVVFAQTAAGLKAEGMISE
ncbi:MAG: hypothetical protein E7470_03070 [Ruminococcaceae bacterium]|nr:hypothetical protein [Oscillospiraceae bacterium]